MKNWLIGAAALTAAIGTYGAGAQAAYPEKPIKIIVGFGAGDAIDGTARVLADRLSQELGGNVVVVNIPGGGGAKGLASAAQESADGYTLVMGSTGALTARPLISKSGYTPDSFAPIAQLTEVPIGLAVAKDSPYTSLADLFAAAKAKPGSVSYATPAPGTTQHINMERFAGQQGITLKHIGGKGGKGAVTKALSGEVDFVFVGASNYTSLAKSGNLRVLGVADEQRAPYLPDAPTFKEQGFDLVAKVWFGLLAPAGTPDDVLAKLRAAVAKVAQSDDTLALYKKYNFNAAYLDSDAFAKRIADNVAEHRVVLKKIGLIK